MAIDKILKIDGANISWTCKQISKMVEKETLSFKNIVQRSFCWDVKRMSELVWSIVMGFPVPPVYAERKNTDNENIKIYDVLDGQQRCTTIHKYLNDEFALSELKPILYLDENGNKCELDISRLKFSELDEEIQDAIEGATITVKYFDNLDQSKKAEMFRRLNNGKPLSTKSRMLASCKNIDGLLDIGSHALFDEMLTDKARANKDQVSIIAKCWCMLNQEIVDVSFESKVLNPLLENIKITDSEKVKLINIFNVIVNVHTILIDRDKKKVAKKLYTETHMVSLVPYIQKAIESCIDDSMIADWLVEFFDVKKVASVSDDYNTACACGSAKNTNILARDEVLFDSYTEFFKVDESTKIEDVDSNNDDESDDDVEDFENHGNVLDDILDDMGHADDD